MLLAIDIGNSNVVCGVFDGDHIATRFRLATRLNATSDEYALAMLGLLAVAKIDPGSIKTVVVSSVVPPLDRIFRALCERYFQCKTHFVSQDFKIPLKVETEQPSEIGADRLVNAYFAWQTYGKAAIVIDLGTATTFDVVNGKGAFVGGAIAPGLKTAAEALFGAASKLSPVDLALPERAIGKNTKECIQSGLVLGYVGLIDFLVTRMSDELNERPVVVATGGLAGPFKAHSKTIEEVNPDLTLQGLNMLFKDGILK